MGEERDDRKETVEGFRDDLCSLIHVGDLLDEEHVLDTLYEAYDAGRKAERGACALLAERVRAERFSAFGSDNDDERIGNYIDRRSGGEVADRIRARGKRSE